MSSDLIAALQALSDRINHLPLVVTSGYRCPAHNARVRGEEDSNHMKGDAADIACPPGLRYDDFYKICLAFPAFKGVGYYPRSRFVHLDVTGNRRRVWLGDAGKYTIPSLPYTARVAKDKPLDVAPVASVAEVQWPDDPPKEDLTL